MQKNYQRILTLFFMALFFQCLSLKPVDAAGIETTTAVSPSTEQSSSEESTAQELTTIQEETTTLNEQTTQETTTTDKEPNMPEQQTSKKPNSDLKKFTVSTLSPLKSKIVVLDPGHCMIHGGAAGHGLREDVVVLNIAKACQKKLNQYGDITVYMTRSTMSCCTRLNLGECLTARNRFSRRLGADFLISFHINWDENSGRTGAFVLPAYRSKYHDRVRVESQALGKLILSELSGLGIQNNGLWLRKLSKGRYSNGARYDYYSIVRNGVIYNIPSLIIEHGYITNPSDCQKYFRTQAKRKLLGEADANAIISYYGLKQKVMNGKFKKQHGAAYFINDKGEKVSGWIKQNGKWYYCSPETGKRMTGFVTVDNNLFYLKSTGEMVTGKFKVKGKTYFAKGNGTIIRNKIWNLGTEKNYFNAKGVQQRGWVTYQNKKYYFSRKTGAMVYGWQKIHKKSYYFNRKTGRLMTKK